MNPETIKGYRTLIPSEVEDINTIKALGEEIGALVQQLEADSYVDQRAIALAKDHLQTGLMWATRAVAQPTTFA